MPDIRIHRDHQLGLKKAREIARQWAEEAEEKFGMECTMIEGAEADTVMFTRAGVDGRLVVAPDHFAIDAKLGFLLVAFTRTIEAEIEKNLDALLDNGAFPRTSGQAAATKADVRPADGAAAEAKTTRTTASVPERHSQPSLLGRWKKR